MRIQRVLFAVTCAATFAACRSGSENSFPKTHVDRVVDVYHNVQVPDDYRWLEDYNKPEVRAWSDAQNVYARSILDHLPQRNAIRDRVAELANAITESYGDVATRPGQIFALKRQPPKQQPFLVVMDSLNAAASARVVVDPNTMDQRGSTSIDFYRPSPDGKLIAVSLSSGGSESGDVHIFDTSTGKEVYEVVPRVNGGTAGGDLAWISDGSGFFYTRYPAPNERPADDLPFYQQVFFHKLGSPAAEDRYELGKDFPKVAEIRIQTHSKKNFVIASLQAGDGGAITQYLRTPDATWHQFTNVDDLVVKADFGSNDDIYLVSGKEAPRGKVLRMRLSAPRLSDAMTILPENQDVVEADFWGVPAVVDTAARIYVAYTVGGPSEIRAYGHGGKALPGPQALPVSSVYSPMAMQGDDLLFGNTSYTTPAAWYLFSPKTGSTTKTSLVTKSSVEFGDAEIVRELATSKDGTRVPLNILRRKGMTPDPSTPALVTGYGGYGVNRTPTYNSTYRLLLDAGFLVVDTNLRGGAEFGEQWHEQGKLTKKQNVFDDFAAVLQYLIDRGYTSPQKLAIIGGSNGGLLMGATVTQHPELMRTAISLVGIYDMLRVELSPNGLFNVTEFGTVKDKPLFDALYAYSPYHHVVNTAYPSVLFLTGANDPRVDPMQSRKMTARLQASGTRRPVLLRTSGNTGHGIGTPLNERIEQNTDIYSFLFNELGIPAPGSGSASIR